MALSLKGRSFFLSLLLLISTTLLLFLFFSFSPNYIINPRNTSITTNILHNKFTFTIKLLTFDRIHSLRRCLRSLADADYAGDRVHLHIFVDHFRTNDSSSPVNQKLSEAHQILDLVDAFRWSHGDKLIHYRTSNAGLQAQWLEAWWPTSDNDFAFVVEDDLELSPLYYHFLKALILKYYYDRSNYDPFIYGASLQRPRFVAGKHGNKLHLNADTQIFLYQIVGTWGQLLFPNPWKEFRLWYDVHKAKDIKPFLQGMVTTGWYTKFGDRIWTPWFIKFIHSFGYFNIYTNFLDERALSTSYRDAGVNYGKTVGPDSKLLDGKSLDFKTLKLPPTRDLKWFDFCFSEVFPWRIVKNINDLSFMLDHFEKQKTVVIISLFRVAQRIASNFICNLERLTLHNFILISDDSDFLTKLAHKGYIAIDANQMIYNIGFDKSSENYKIDLLKEIWVGGSIIQKCLKLGYDVRFMNGNMILVSASLPEHPDHSDFVAAKDLELLFVKSSSSSLKIWTKDYISQVASVGKLLSSDSSVPWEQKNFVSLVIKTLKDYAGAKLRFYESNIAVKLETKVNNTFLQGKTNMLFWPEEMQLALIEKGLENMELWLIDADSSCAAVICHNS